MSDVAALESARLAVADPTTPAATLSTISSLHPKLWVEIANHPNTYSDLLTWLYTYGDATVKSAVDKRRAAEVKTPTPDQSQTVVMPPPLTPLPPVSQQPSVPTVQMPALPLAGATGGNQVPPPRQGSRTPKSPILIALIGILAVSLIAAGVLLALNFFGKKTEPPAPTVTVTVTSTPVVAQEPATPTPSPSPKPTLTPSPIPTVSPTPTPSPTPTQSPEAQAKARLNKQAEADLPVVMATIEDEWTTMLSSKKKGLEWAGITWTYQDIWSEYSQYKQRYPNTLLVQGTPYKSLSALGPEWYSMTSGIVFNNADQALSWCYAQNLTNDYCFAFRFTDMDGPNQKQQPL